MSLVLPVDDSSQNFDIDNNGNSQSFSQLSSWRSDDNVDNDDYQKVEEVVEYEWPQGSGQDYFIEEYLADYLEIKSLRRFYPTVERRRIQTLDEREYLLERGFVNALQCDLGVIVIPADQVYKHIAPNYIEKFETYSDAMLQKNYEKTISSSVNTNSVSPGDYLKSCASWNAKSNKKARGNRCMDKWTSISHNVQKELCGSDPHNMIVGCFPLAVKPGQYVDYSKRFSSEVLFHLPVNTILKGPYTFATNYSLPLNDNERETELPFQEESNKMDSHRSPSDISECSTINCDTDSESSSSSTITTCSISEFDIDFGSSSYDSFSF